MPVYLCFLLQLLTILSFCILCTCVCICVIEGEKQFNNVFVSPPQNEMNSNPFFFSLFLPSSLQSCLYHCLPLPCLFVSLPFSPPKDPADSSGDIPDPDRGYSGREGV